MLVIAKNKTPKEIQDEKIKELAESLTRSAYDSQTDAFMPVLLFGLVLGLGALVIGFFGFLSN